MKKRPLCAVSLLFALAILMIRFLGLPLLPGEKEEKLIASCLETSYEITVSGKVAKSEIRDDYSVLVLSQAVFTAEGKSFRLGKLRITCDGKQKYEVGVRIRAAGLLSEMPGPSNPGQFDSRLYSRISGIGYRMKKPKIEVTDASVDVIGQGLAQLHDFLYERICENFPEDVRGIISAMVIGDKTLLMDGQKEAWQAGGIVHMLSISGMHLTLLGMGLFSLLRKMKMGIRPAGMISLLFLFFYAIFTGASISTIRAFLMFLFLITAKMTGRTYDSANAIALSALLILADNPWYLFYSGFQLSYSAVITCAAFRKCSRFLLGVMLYLTTIPILLYTFYEIPVFGIFLNFLLVPLLPAVLAAGIAGMTVGGIAAFPAVFLVRFYEGTLSLVKKMPAMTFILGKPETWMTACYILLLISGILLFKMQIHLKRRLFLFLGIPVLIGLFTLRFPSDLKLSFLDTGQGDGIVLQTPSGVTALVDSGSSTVSDVGTWRVLPYLKFSGVRRLDYLFVTHMDDDHAGGVREILTAVRDGNCSISLGTLALPKMKTKSEAYRKMERLAREAKVRILYLSEGDALAFGQVRIRVLNPLVENEGQEDSDENGQCLVLSVSFGRFDALLTGDVSGLGEESLVSGLQEKPKEYEVLKVAHHGSRFSTPAEFLKIVRPKVSILSAGAGNRYGHPHAELLRRLRSCGTDIFQTEYGGETEIVTDGVSFSVTPFLSSQTEKTEWYTCTD